MATTTLTRNLKLKISSDLTDDSVYNLNRLDSLGSVYSVDSNQTAKVRSQTNILITPNDADIGGSGNGGEVAIGSSDQLIDSFSIYATEVNFGSGIRLFDQATGGTTHLNINYKSDINGVVDTADRSITIDTENADRTLVIGGNLLFDNDLTLLMTAATTLTLPESGELASDINTLVFSDKTISGLTNTFTDISNVSIAATAAISGTKISPDFGAQAVQTTGGFSSSPGIAFNMPSSDGSLSQVLATNGAGQLSFTDVLTATLNEFNVRIGNPSNVQTPVDTSMVGDIAGSSTGGLTIKPGVIDNADIDVAAGIEVTKLAGTADTAIEIGPGGAAQSSAVTRTELNNLTGSTSNIQTQLDAKAGSFLTFKTNWTQADGSSKAVLHNIGSLDVKVELYDTADGQTVFVDTVTRTDTNTLALTGVNLPATFDYRILIIEIG